MPGQGDVTRILGSASFFWKNVSVAFFGMNHSKYHGTGLAWSSWS